ncbi:restriction endonuclease subunit S [Helicobacter pylori]
MDALATPSNWQKVRLGDILSYEQPTKYLVATTQYLQKGFTPILTAGKTFILGYTNDKHGIYMNIPVIIFDDFTTDSKMVNFPFKVKSSAIKILSLRDNNQADLKYIYEKLTLLKHQVTDHKRYWIDEFSNIEIPLPPLNEQIAIANILSDLDRYLYNLDALILKKESVKKALRIKMLNQILASNGVEFRELGDIILSLKTGLNPRSFFKLNTPNANNYYVTIRELEDYTIKFTHQTDRIDDNALSLCLKRSNLEKDDILFSGTGTIGKVSIIEKNPNNWAIKEGIYSIKPNKKIVFPRFLMFCLESSNIQNDIKNKSFGGIVKSIPMNDLQQIQIPLPPLNEQIAIANILSALDSEIISLKNKKRQFDNIKKALNHDLMSAKIRVLKK